MKRIFSILAIFLFSMQGYGQIHLLDRPDLLLKIKSELSFTYSYDFSQARTILNGLKNEIPGHPVLSLMEALNIYWENFPLTPENPKSEVFLALLEDAVLKGESILEKEPESLEGLFFELFPRALYSEYWADNGKPGKVFPYLNSLYKHTLKGMEVQDRFKEFYFTSGLYNYYVEAYPEKHPAYKAVKILFQAGDKEKGLQQLINCAENAVFVKNEARTFLAYIYMNYESNPLKASGYSAGLYREFPRNPLYVGRYAEILIYDNKLAVADIIVNNLAKLPGEFPQMQFHLYKGLMDEKYRKNYESAFAEYKAALQYCEKYGEAGNVYNAQAWMGLGRYYKHKGEISVANRYFRMAEDVSTYEYVVNDR
jgi:hypothetical protein